MMAQEVGGVLQSLLTQRDSPNLDNYVNLWALGLALIKDVLMK